MGERLDFIICVLVRERDVLGTGTKDELRVTIDGRERLIRNIQRVSRGRTPGRDRIGVSRLESGGRKMGRASGINDSVEHVIDLFVFETHRVEDDLITMESVGTDEYAGILPL